MFDMGFEPQVRSIMGQIRPDRCAPSPAALAATPAARLAVPCRPAASTLLPLALLPRSGPASPLHPGSLGPSLC